MGFFHGLDCVSSCIFIFLLASLLDLAEDLSLLSSLRDLFFLDFFFLPSLEESSESLEGSVLEEEESEYEDDGEDAPFLFSFFLDDDFRAAFTLSLSMRPFLAKRRTILSSVFFASFFFLRFESFSASFVMKLTVPSWVF